MPDIRQQSMGAEVDSIRESAMRLTRLMSQARTHAHVAREAQTTLDKLAEVILSHMTDTDDVEPRLSDLSKRLGVEMSSLSRKVQKLLEAGMVTRTSDPQDARAWRLHLTDQGRNELAKLQRSRAKLLTAALADWSERDRRKFAELFALFTGGIAQELGDPK